MENFSFTACKNPDNTIYFLLRLSNKLYIYSKRCNIPAIVICLEPAKATDFIHLSTPNLGTILYHAASTLWVLDASNLSVPDDDDDDLALPTRLHDQPAEEPVHALSHDDDDHTNATELSKIGFSLVSVQDLQAAKGGRRKNRQQFAAVRSDESGFGRRLPQLRKNNGV
eukprot:CAMPEP_0197298546 /NCGR_PEP_ID=MMETSP0890-20130614/43788_1 /TAXON_ID=44058 ORGANISM="Aureoumbra lagunensis, Strain CCMP1510" /NCGR_SAMPLE_ID=MMETSP0890 /ASSEMBLY_ACC=CAM_ASM_000533 /LENGTH=168 /DNA_ID=CAMNT_0042776367 /DNA_START=333 /DNA_END=839 /DNA_ORIENTATION=+